MQCKASICTNSGVQVTCLHHSGEEDVILEDVGKSLLVMVELVQQIVRSTI